MADLIHLIAAVGSSKRHKPFLLSAAFYSASWYKCYLIHRHPILLRRHPHHLLKHLREILLIPESHFIRNLIRLKVILLQIAACPFDAHPIEVVDKSALEAFLEQRGEIASGYSQDLRGVAERDIFHVVLGNVLFSPLYQLVGPVLFFLDTRLFQPQAVIHQPV